MLYGLDVIGLESSPSNVSSAQIRFQRLSKQSSALRKRIDRDWGTVKVEPGCARFVTCAVDATLDLRKTLESPCTVTPSVDYLLCGLHTCGALGGNLTELFIKNSSAKALIFVGCCYHLMDERSSCGLKSENAILKLSLVLTLDVVFILRDGRIVRDVSSDKLSALSELLSWPKC